MLTQKIFMIFLANMDLLKDVILREALRLSHSKMSVTPKTPLSNVMVLNSADQG
jgi:hypothetical protein